MASFSSAAEALECAIAVQRAFEQRNHSAEEPISVRVGLNAGEPIPEGKGLFGTAVNEAARITAAPGVHRSRRQQGPFPFPNEDLAQSQPVAVALGNRSRSELL
jgi:hypothetical protein